MTTKLTDELPGLLADLNAMMDKLAFLSRYLNHSEVRQLYQEEVDDLQDTSEEVNAWCSSLLKLTDAEMGVIVKHFSKRFFAAQSTSLEKTKLLLSPLNSTEWEALRHCSESTFEMMKRLRASLKTVLQHILLFVSQDRNIQMYENHRHISRLVLDGMSSCALLSLMWTSLDVVPALLSVYEYMRSCENGAGRQAPEGTSIDERELIDWVHHQISNPMICIHEEINKHQKTSNVLASILLSQTKSFDQVSDLGKIANLNLLDLSKYQNGEFASDPLLDQVADHHRQLKWTLCLALCLPDRVLQAFAAEKEQQKLSLWTLLKLSLEDRLVIIVHQDVLVNVHQAFYRQLSMVTASTITQPKNAVDAKAKDMSIQLLRKEFASQSKQAVLTMATRHERDATILRIQVALSLKLLRAQPAFCGPLLPLYIGLLGLLRDEIEWWMSHASASFELLLPSTVKPKHLQSIQSVLTGSSQRVCDLFSHFLQLREHLLRNTDVVQNYFQQFFDGYHYETLQQALSKLREPSTQSTQISTLRDEMSAWIERVLLSIKRGRRLDAEPFRKEWDQLKNNFFEAGSNPLQDVELAIERMVLHSAFEEFHQQYLLKNSPLSACWWFLPQFKAIFEETIDTQFADSVALVTCVENLREEVDVNISWTTVGIERDITFMELEQLQQEMESSIRDHFRTSLTKLMENEIMIWRSSRPGVVAAAQVHPSSQTKQIKSSTLSLDSDAILHQELALMHFIEKCGSSSNAHLQDVYVESIEQCLTLFIHNLLPIRKTKDRLGNLEIVVEPKMPLQEMLEEIQIALRCINRLSIADSSTMSSEKLAHVVESETRSKAVCDTTNSTFEVTSEEWTLVDRFSHFYVSFLEDHCSYLSFGRGTLVLVYPEITQLLLAPSQTAQKTGGDPTDYTSVDGIKTLHRFIGDDGMMEIIQNLAGVVTKNTQDLVSAIEADQVALIRLRHTLRESMKEILMSIRQMNMLETFVAAAEHIGNALVMIELLSSPLVSRQRTKLEDGKLVELDRHIENELILRLRDEIKVQNGTWKLVTSAFVASFHSRIWKQSQVMETNAHMMGYAVGFLFRAFPESLIDDVCLNSQCGCTHGQERCVLQRCAQMALSLHAADKALPSLSMCHAMETFANYVDMRAPLQEVSLLDSLNCWLPNYSEQSSRNV